jgi:general secretion pathway protein G
MSEIRASITNHRFGRAVLCSRPPTPACHTGFTLLELLVVMVIIGMLAAFVAPRYFGQLGKSEVTLAKAQLEAFGQALDAFRLDVGRYPLAEEGLQSLLARPASADKWNGPYLKMALPRDPWGRAYIYRTPGARGEYEVLSLGPDGQGSGADLVRP